MCCSNITLNVMTHAVAFKGFDGMALSFSVTNLDLNISCLLHVLLRKVYFSNHNQDLRKHGCEYDDGDSVHLTIFIVGFCPRGLCPYPVM